MWHDWANPEEEVLPIPLTLEPRRSSAPCWEASVSPLMEGYGI